MLGAVTKGTVPIINTIVAKVVPDKRLYEKAFGISSLTTGIAAALSSVAYGFIAEKYSILSVFHVSAFFALCAPIPITLRHLHLSFRKSRKTSP
jgi:MFS family permease